VSDGAGNLATSEFSFMGNQETQLRPRATPAASPFTASGHVAASLDQGFVLNSYGEELTVLRPGASGGWTVSTRGLFPHADAVDALCFPGQLPVLLGWDHSRPGVLWLERLGLDAVPLARLEWPGDSFETASFESSVMDASGAALVRWRDAAGTHARWLSPDNAWQGQAFSLPAKARLEALIGGGLLLDRSRALAPPGLPAPRLPRWEGAVDGELLILRERWYAVAEAQQVRVFSRSGRLCGTVRLAPSTPADGLLTVASDGTLEGPSTQCSDPDASWLRVVWLWPHALQPPTRSAGSH